MPINYLAIFVATIVFYILGAIYYSVIEKQYISAQETTKEKLLANPKWGGTIAPYIISFVFLLIMNIVFANLLSLLTPANLSVSTGAWLGFLIWLGFVLPTITIFNAYENKTKTLTVINGAYFLVGLVISGIILAVIR